MVLAKSFLSSYCENMSAQEGYLHIYNRGIDGKAIFASKEDFEIFQTFLKEYLNPAKDLSRAKKTFTIKGKTFQGVPHLPKNYFGKIDLATYSLEPNSFHLLLKEKVKGSIPSFVRSLCTRYSMYFNKKYTRTGPLFEGPYKSTQIKDESEFLKNQTTEPKEKEEKLIPTSRRVPEFAAAFVIFLVLVTFGIRNITATNASVPQSPPPQVSGVETEIKKKIEPKTLVAIKTTDGVNKVSVRMEPTTASTKIGEVLNGEIFEFVSINSGWYEVRLPDGSTGFISARYIEVVEGDGQ